MSAIPSRVRDRIVTNIKKFQPIVAAAKAKDVGEGDTVALVHDMLAELFGYDRFSEITSECKVKANFADLAVKLEEKIQLLIEVKAIGKELRDHRGQARGYAADKGIDWVVLTNGDHWQVLKLVFDKPIECELVLEFRISELDRKSESSIEKIYTISKEGWAKSALELLDERKEALNRYFIGAIISSDQVLSLVRRVLRRVSPDVKISADEIKAVLIDEVLKREILEDEKADAARKRVAKVLTKKARPRAEPKSPQVAGGAPT